jgi:hypothetical protein
MTHTPWSFQLGAVGGAAFVVLAVIADFFQAPQLPPASAPADTISAFLVSSQTGLQRLALLEGLATAFLLWFVVSLSRTLRAAEGEAGTLAPIALVGGVATTVLNWVWCALIATLASMAAEQVDGGVRVVFNLSNLVLALMQFPIALFLGATAAAALQTRALPRWLGWFGAVVVVVGLAGAAGRLLAANGALGLVGFLLLLTWLLATSIVLTRRVWAPQSAPSHGAVAAPAALP